VRKEELSTYNGDPVDDVGVVREGGDEVGRDAHDDERRDPVQNVVGEDGWTVQLVGGTGGGAVVICAVPSHVAL
jgi:hypothetical protein